MVLTLILNTYESIGACMRLLDGTIQVSQEVGWPWVSGELSGTGGWSSAPVVYSKLIQ
jgi:hypothetical protein